MAHWKATIFPHEHKKFQKILKIDVITAAYPDQQKPILGLIVL